MKQFIRFILMTLLLLNGAVVLADVQSFSGENNGMSPTFKIDGPWTMDWRAKSEFPLLASVEMRLHDGESGDFLGMIAEIKGTGNGLKVFENGGTYQVIVVGTFVEWDFQVEQISEEQAASLIRSTVTTPDFTDSVNRLRRLVPESSFSSWRPQGDENLLLFSDDGLAWRVDFSPGCPGLAEAKVLSFVMTSDAGGKPAQYDSILLENGTRCYFRSVIPGAAPQSTSATNRRSN